MTTTLSFLFFIIAMLYAAVGHGGGSGYLAVMGAVGTSPEIMKPTALALNVLVAGIGTIKYQRAGYFSGALFWPIAAASIPFAFLGGRLSLPIDAYKWIVGVVLLIAAYRLARPSQQATVHNPGPKTMPLWLTLSAGAGIGLLSGLVGLGGGILLSPLLLLAGWADTRQTMGVTAAFVFANSLAGLLGHLSSFAALPDSIPWWLLSVGLGGWVGAEFGSRRLDPIRLRQLLAFILAVGGLRMILA